MKVGDLVLWHRQKDPDGAVCLVVDMRSQSTLAPLPRARLLTHDGMLYDVPLGSHYSVEVISEDG